MRHLATRELFDYWDRLRGERSAPERSDIDLGAIRNLLADLFMLEVDNGHHFPFVMSGSRVNAFFCGEQKGRAFLDLWRGRDQQNIAAALLTVIDAACPVIACAEARPEGYAKTDLEILLLPLRHNGYAQARILGLMTAAKKPTWLGLLAVEAMVLRSLRAIEDGALMGGAFDAQFPEPQRPDPPELRSHLRVIPGGR